MISVTTIRSNWHYIILIAAITQIILLYHPKNVLINKDVESALRRARTDSCKRELSEFAKKTVTNQYTPKLLRSCKLDQSEKRFQKIGCISNATVGLVRIEDIVLNSSLCLHLCFSYGHSHGGYDAFKKICFCGDEDVSPDTTQDSICYSPEKLDWFQVNRGIFYPNDSIVLKPKDSHNTTVKIAFLLILNGRSELQVYRLLKNIYSSRHLYYIHVDKREDYLFRRLSNLKQNHSNLILSTSRFNTIWGGSSLLYMILDAVKRLSKHDWDYLINLSESDFPIKPITELETFLAKDPTLIYLKLHNIKGYRFIKKQGLDRNFYQCEDRAWRMGKRSLPLGIVYSGGSDWFALPKNFCLHIIENLNNDTCIVKPLLEIYNYTLLPVESFFHTFALNSEFCDRVLTNNLRLTNWHRKQGCKCQHKDIVDWCGCSPLVYRLSDWDKLVETVNAKDLFFARKFDPTVSSSIIAMVEEYLVNKGPSRAEQSSYDTRYWLSVYVRDKYNIAIDHQKLMLEQFSFFSLKSLEDTFDPEIINPSLESVDSYYKQDRFVGLILNQCTQLGCLQVLVKRKNDANLANYNHECFRSSGFSLNVIQVNHGFDTGERMFKDYQPLYHKSDIVVYHEWKVNEQSQSLNSLNKSLQFIWTGPRNRIELEQTVTLKSSSKPIKLSLAHRLNIPKPLTSGLWTLTVSFRDIKCLDYRFIVFDREIFSKEKISLKLFSLFYDVTHMCWESKLNQSIYQTDSCNNHEWSLINKSKKIQLQMN